MKNVIKKINKSKYKIIIYISLVALVVLLISLLVIIVSKNKENKIYEKLNEQNKNIVVSEEYKEKPGTFIRRLDTLTKEHCKNNICIKNMKIYYIGTEGRIEYEITNKSKKKVSGAFKLKFDDGNTTYVIYNKLNKNDTVKGVISFTNTDFSNVYDYKMIALKKDELKKLLNKK